MQCIYELFGKNYSESALELNTISLTYSFNFVTGISFLNISCIKMIRYESPISPLCHSEYLSHSATYSLYNFDEFLIQCRAIALLVMKIVLGILNLIFFPCVA